MENNFKNEYELCCDRANSETERENYWKEAAEQVSWFKFPTKILNN